MTVTPELISDLLQRLDHLDPSVSAGKKVITGFDGFIDRIKRPVSSRFGDTVEMFRTISEFAQRLKDAAGKSCQVEMITQKAKAGGNAPILAETLSRAGINCLCIGAMGYPDLHEVFNDPERTYRAISILKPGKSDAIEFDDGKVIFSDLSVFEHFNWKYVRITAGIDVLRREADETNLFVFADWANLPHAADIWQGMLDDVIRPAGRTDRYFMFDLCDPARKTDVQVKKVLDLIGTFSDFGKVTLGLNENETLRIYKLLYGADATDVRVAGGRLFSNMTIETLMVHPTDRCILFSREGVSELPGFMVKEPRVLTGGGDNLNAGYCLGRLYGFEPVQAVVLGMASAAAYIRNGFAPGLHDTKAYLRQWLRSLEPQASGLQPH